MGERYSYVAVIELSLGDYDLEEFTKLFKKTKIINVILGRNAQFISINIRGERYIDEISNKLVEKVICVSSDPIDKLMGVWEENSYRYYNVIADWIEDNVGYRESWYYRKSHDLRPFEYVERGKLSRFDSYYDIGKEAASKIKFNSIKSIETLEEVANIWYEGKDSADEFNRRARDLYCSGFMRGFKNIEEFGKIKMDDFFDSKIKIIGFNPTDKKFRYTCTNNRGEVTKLRKKLSGEGYTEIYNIMFEDKGWALNELKEWRIKKQKEYLSDKYIKRINSEENKGDLI